METGVLAVYPRLLGPKMLMFASERGVPVRRQAALSLVDHELTARVYAAQRFIERVRIRPLLLLAKIEFCIFL